MEKPRRPCSLFKRPTVKQHTFVYYVSQFGSAFGLSLETGRAQLFKGILEGIAYELKVNIASFQRARIPVRALRAIGGGSRSDTWMQLKADILGIPIERTSVTEAGCLGAAFLAGLGTRRYAFSTCHLSPAPETSRTFVYAVKSPVRMIAFTSRLLDFKASWGMVSKVIVVPRTAWIWESIDGLWDLVSSATTSFSTEKCGFRTPNTSVTRGLFSDRARSTVSTPSGMGKPASQTISSSMCPIRASRRVISLLRIPPSCISYLL